MSKLKFNPLYAALAFLTLVGVLFWPFSSHGIVSSSTAGSATSKADAGHVTHVVLFEWKKAVDPDAVVMVGNVGSRSAHPGSVLRRLDIGGPGTD